MRGLRLLLVMPLMVGFMGEIDCVEVLSVDKDICRLFKDGVKLRQPGSCSVGIKCENFKSVENLVCGSGTYYDRNTMKCTKSTSDTYCKEPCVASSTGYVKDPKNCKGWYNCNGKAALSSGYCPENLVFNAASVMCDYPENSSCVARYNFCDVVPNGTPFLNENDCRTYYVCERQKNSIVLAEKECGTGKYFDVKTATCLPKKKVKCSRLYYPENVCGTTKLAIRNRFVSDGATCRGYFYCRDLGVGKPDLTPTWGQCPNNKFFDPKEEACKSTTSVKCHEDRCDGRDDGYELSSKTGCQHFLVCESGETVEERECGDNMWFDAAAEKCTSTKQSYAACA